MQCKDSLNRKPLDTRSIHLSSPEKPSICIHSKDLHTAFFLMDGLIIFETEAKIPDSQSLLQATRSPEKP
jgi:hypothetical protein